MTSAISGSTPAATSTSDLVSALTSTSGSIQQTISGLASGLDTSSIIAQLVAASRQSREGPVNAQIAAAQAKLLAYSQITADTTTLLAASTRSPPAFRGRRSPRRRRTRTRCR